MSSPLDSDALSELFDLIREDAPGAVWSQGVGLSRAATVSLTADSTEDEIVLQVTTPVGIVARKVTLFPEDEDYLCDCSPKEMVCEHIVAAIVTLKRADERGEPLTVETSTHATVHYRLRRNNAGLGFHRVVRAGETETPLRGSVGAAAMRRDGPQVVATPLDLEVERKVGNKDLRWVPPGQMVSLLHILSRVDDLRLDDEPVGITREDVGLRVVVTDAEDGSGAFLLTAEQDPDILEVFNNGVALCRTPGDAPLALRPIGQSGLTAREMTDLREGQRYGQHQLSELVGVILPGLRRRVAVAVLTQRLPELTRADVRMSIDVTTEGHELVVFPTLVYGDPPIATVEAGRLVPLGKVVPERQWDDEKRLARRLDSVLGIKAGQKARFAGVDAVAFASRLGRWKGERTGDPLNAFHVAPELKVSLERLGDADLAVSFETSGPTSAGHIGSANAQTVLDAWKSGASLVPLEGGGWAPIPSSWLNEHGQILSDLLAARAMADGLPMSSLPDAARLCEAIGEAPPPAFSELRALVSDFDALPNAERPRDLTATLRHYQETGVNWLSFCREAGLGAMLADDMGLGKTLQALTTLDGRALVVAPTSVLPNWSAEARRFRPDLRVNVYHGPRRELDPDADVTLTTYAILRLDIDRLAAERWDVALLDEAQAIKNPDSKVTRAAYRLDARWRVTLTGTPVENHLHELWSQLHFLNPGLLGSRSDFDERYAKPIGEGDAGAAAHLRRRIKPFVLRRLKRDVAPELPPRTDHVLYCQLDDTERAVYDAVRAATQDDLVARLRAGGNVMEALEALLRLRQAACHTDLIPGQSATSSTKVAVLVDALSEAAEAGHKALVFSQWTGMLDRIEPHLKRANLPFVRLDGSTRDRQGVVAAFQSDDGPPVMLISLKAGGTGLNLTAADHVFLVDPWWNPAVEDQAADRAHRIGQDKPVFVHRLVASDTVEEGILALQEQKRALAEAALGGAAAAATLTRDDLLSLLER